MIVYHRTTQEAASSILADGFRDGEGTYLTSEIHRGVWVSDSPLDANEGASGCVLFTLETPSGLFTLIRVGARAELRIS